jgi:hypothetical protein
MKWAVTRDSSEVQKSDVVRDVGLDVVEDAAEPIMIEAVRRWLSDRACPTIGVLLKDSCRQRQGRRLDIHATGGRLDRKLGENSPTGR